MPDYESESRKPAPVRRRELTRRLAIRWTLGFLLVAVPAAIFVDLAGDVWLKEGFPWDAPIMLAIHSLTAPWLTTLMLVITQLGNIGAAVVTLAAFLALWRLHRLLDGITVAASVAGATLMDAGLKVLFARPRPDVFPPLVSTNSYSFPSGHTLVAVALYGLLAIFLWRWQHRGWAVASGLLVLLIGFSRVYLGAHYPSDVLASWTLGTVWLVAVMLVHDWAAKRYVTSAP
jgi:membrane-associated phospholipid phosphatase